jgi:ribosomal protein L21
MYAVVDLQGHQYIVSEGAEIVVDNLGVAQSEKFVVDKVLVAFSQDGKDIKVGKPTIEGATVEFEVGVTQKGEKVQVLKFKRKNRYARLKGFRPLQTVLTVKKINA